MNFNFYLISILFGISLFSLIATLKNGNKTYHFTLKPLTILLIIFLGIASKDFRDNSFNQLILIGLLFSFLGDILLMFGKKEFLYGMGSFFLAHVFYINAFYIVNMKFNLILFIIIFGITSAYYFYLYSTLYSYRGPVLLYSLIIGTMLYFAISHFLIDNQIVGKLIILGAVLFTISNMLLAIRQFKGNFPLSSELVYLTYYPAQYLFCLTIWTNNYI